MTPPRFSVASIIKGGWQLAGGHGAVDHDVALADMAAFTRAGITTFDCADIYTGVEALIGRFLAGLPAAERTGVRVHTKFVPDLAALPSLSFADVERGVERSRRRLGVESLHLVQLHWWDFSVPGWIEAALHLARLRHDGRLQGVGLTNFDAARLQEVLDTGVPVVSHQVQYSLLDRRPAGDMAALCTERGVQLLCYGTLAGGFLSERWLGAPEPHGPVENRSLTKYKLIIDEFGGWALFQSLLDVLHDIAREHGVVIGTVALRWALDQPAVSAVIVGSRGASHLAATLAASTLSLTPADHARLEAVLTRSTGPAGGVYELERDRTGLHGRIMRYDLNRPNTGQAPGSLAG